MGEPVDTSAEAVRVTNPSYAEYLNSPAGKIITEQREQIVSLQSSLAAAQQRIADLEALLAERNRHVARALACAHGGLSFARKAYPNLVGDFDAIVAALNAAMAANGDDWLTREARQIGLHSPACASVRFGQNECDCGAAMAAKEAG